MSDIKKFLNIISETTTSGAIATSSGAVGNSVLKRPVDTIFAAEEATVEPDCGPEDAPKVDSPSNFGLWKNTVLAGKEQRKTDKKIDLKSKEMYPQLKEGRDRDAYERDYDHSVAGMDKRSSRAYQADGGANDEGWGREQQSSGQWYIMINGQSEKSGKMYSSNIEAHRRGEAIKQIYRDKGYKVPRIDVIQSKTFEESKTPDKLDIPAPRNFVAKNAINTGAGKHKDKKKAEKQGDFKHKNRSYDLAEASLADMRAHFAKDGASKPMKDGYVAYIKGKPSSPISSTPQIAKAHIPLDTPLTWVEIKRVRGVAEGYTVIPGIDREKYVERPGLEGPFGTKSGKTVYYDPREGKYYDPDTDMYIEYDDWQAMNECGMAESDNFKAPAAMMKASPQAMAQAQSTIQQQADKNVMGQAKIAGAVPNQGVMEAFAYKKVILRDLDKWLQMAGEKCGYRVQKVSDNHYQAWRDLNGAPRITGLWFGGNDKHDPEFWLRVPKTPVDEGEWDGTGAADMAAATAQAAADADSAETEKQISLSEEMIADRLRKELALFKKGSKSKDRGLGKKPADKEVHSKQNKD